MNERPRIGAMIWRIGELIDLDRQLEWIRNAGFDGVGVHACAGVPGQWRGIEPSACTPGERERLRLKLDGFSFAEIHAPFAIDLQVKSLPADMAGLRPVLDLAADLGAGIVTVHARLPGSAADPDCAAWLGPMRKLNADAARARTVVALELLGGFDVAMSWGLSNVGVNLDVGHMYLPANRSTLRDLGGIGSLIRHLGSALVHLHLHDVEGDTDHIEIGAGKIDFAEIAAALGDIGYAHGMTLELNPDRVAPDGMRRSAEYLRACFREARAK